MVNRYEIYGEIAAGGMATVEYGRMFGPLAFSRPVAIKRLHPHLAKDPAFAAMFLDEARLSARLMHANIVQTLDVIEQPRAIALVMAYLPGEALSSLLQLASGRRERVPIKIAAGLTASVLHGLHAAHESRDDQDALLGVVHRDVSPHNILVGEDGVPRVLDFGIAKATDHLRLTPVGEIKGKLAYIAPEQLAGRAVDRRADVYGASAVLWELLTGFMLFEAHHPRLLVERLQHERVTPPSAHVTGIPRELDAIVMRGLAHDCDHRYASAYEMAVALESSVGVATQSEVSGWLQHLAAEVLGKRAAELRRLERRRPVPLYGPTKAQDQRAFFTADTSLANRTPAGLETIYSPTTRMSAGSQWWTAKRSALVLAVLLLAAWLYQARARTDVHASVLRPRPAVTATASRPETLALQPVASLLPAAVPAENAQPGMTTPLEITAAAPIPATTPPPAATTVPATTARDTAAMSARVRPRNKRALAPLLQGKKLAATVAPGEARGSNTKRIAEPTCSPVIYIDGIRSLNPDCHWTARPTK